MKAVGILACNMIMGYIYVQPKNEQTKNDVHITKIHMQVACLHHITTCGERVRKSYRMLSTEQIPVP